MMAHLQMTDTGHSVEEQQAVRRKCKTSFIVDFCDAVGSSNTSSAVLITYKNVLGGYGQSQCRHA